MVEPLERGFLLVAMKMTHSAIMHGVRVDVGEIRERIPPLLPAIQSFGPIGFTHGLLCLVDEIGVVSVEIVRSFHVAVNSNANLRQLRNMEYPVYLKLSGTENVYAVQGPNRFWECARMGERWMFHDVIAKTWPERQRILDMLEEDGPWHRITPGEFDLCLQQSQANSGLESTAQLNILEQVDLAEYTTFGISALAKWFVSVHNLAELRAALAWASDRGCDLMILGGGSNILLHGDIEKLVIHVQIEGVDVCSDDGRSLEVSAGAGAVWHDFVMQTLDHGWGGLENLSLIPGSVGASPMQNIGAYGVEIQDRFAWLDAVRISDGALQRFDKDQCGFGYRESVFKREEKGKWVLVRVAFLLDRQSSLHTEYGAIEQELQDIPLVDRTHRDVSDAVIRIRQSKLPDPSKIGNAGSFFKNPTVTHDVLDRLLETHPDMPRYPQQDGRIKLAAGWLIEQAGWKGHNRGSHGVHDRQALVLVHFGGASGKEIWTLAQEIMTSVHEKFGVQLEPEVNQIGN